MQKVILLTGATDGIGFETAKLLLTQGHKVLIHGRNSEKLLKAENELQKLGDVEPYLADLSDLKQVKQLAELVREKHNKLDVLINNAGVFKTANPITDSGLDVRFVVNSIAPYLLTRLLVPILEQGGRVVNLSSAAQASVDIDALKGSKKLTEFEAYAQSKLAITMWSRLLAKELAEQNIIVSPVNPGSLLASKMVKQGFGVAGSDLSIGATILQRAAIDDEFAAHSGEYFDNDSGQFADPFPDALDDEKSMQVMQCIEQLASL